MKRNTPEHWKMEMLIAELAIGLAQAIGHIELLFHLTSKQAPHGDIGKIPDSIIAKRCGWVGDPEVFVNALVKCRWLDVSEEHRYVVHDWHEHCDDATKKVVTRSSKKFASPLAQGKKFIYAIQAVESKRIKIGFTELPVATRLSQLQTGCPEKLIILGYTEAGVNEESILHNRFKAHSISGEWFHGHEDILTHVRQWRTVADMPEGDVCLPSLALPSLALPEPSPPSPAIDVVFQDLPKPLETEVFKSSWLRWEDFRRRTHSQPIQPMMRAPAWHGILERAPPGKESDFGVSTIRQAMANGWKNLYPQEEKQHGRRRDVTSRDSGKSAGGGRAENIKPRIVNLDP